MLVSLLLIVMAKIKSSTALELKNTLIEVELISLFTTVIVELLMEEQTLNVNYAHIIYRL